MNIGRLLTIVVLILSFQLQLLASNTYYIGAISSCIPPQQCEPMAQDRSTHNIAHFGHFNPHGPQFNPHGPQSGAQQFSEYQDQDYCLDHSDAPLYRFLMIDIDNPESKKELEDSAMRLYLDQYLKNQADALAQEKAKCQKALLADTYFLSGLFDYANRAQIRSRLSFIVRLQKGLAQKLMQNPYGFTGKKPVQLSPHLVHVFQDSMQEFKEYGEFDSDHYYAALKSNLARMEREGLLKLPDHKSKNLLVHGFKHFLMSLIPNNPFEKPREFSLNVLKYTGLLAFHALTSGSFVPAQMAISIGLQAQRMMSLDTANMADEQVAEAIAEELATVAWDIAVAKAAPIIQDKTVRLGSNLLKRMRPFKKAVLTTAEGVEFKLSQAELAQETGILKNAADKKTSGGSSKSLSNRQDIPKVANMKNVFSLNDFGKKLEKYSVKTKLEDIKTNSQIYEIVKKMPEFGLKKGDQLYLDKFHGDHIEVFRNRVCINVLNLNGTIYQGMEKALGRPLLAK